ncbi:hypothetical protein Tco_0683229 [Tanacetum coccineum]|uniref:Uncharacterized protein n=1 Tax=Tanacetum coccineum TaxID=301880 RepID=A0ABQ4XTD8_9ASTR
MYSLRYRILAFREELDIDVADHDMGNGISLPKYLFTCSSLVHLKLYQCFFDNLDVTYWKNLMEFALALFIDITNESVNNFVICGSSTEDIDTLQIVALHIQSLTIKSKFDLAAILLLNVSSVVQAKLDYCTTYNFYGNAQTHRIELLKGLLLIPHIKELKVG